MASPGTDRQGSARADAAATPMSPTSPVPRLSRKAASQLYSGGPPLSHREAAASTRDRPSQRAGNAEVTIFSQLLTDRHSTAAEKMKAATELGNLALDENKEVIADTKGALAALVTLARDGTTAQARERAAGALRNLAVESWKNKEAIGEAGGIPPLVALASSATSSETTVDFAVGALASLALDADNKKLIAEAGGIATLVAHVENGATPAIQTLSAIALGKCATLETGTPPFPIVSSAPSPIAGGTRRDRWHGTQHDTQHSTQHGTWHGARQGTLPRARCCAPAGITWTATPRLPAGPHRDEPLSPGNAARRPCTPPPVRSPSHAAVLRMCLRVRVRGCVLGCAA